MARFFLTYIVGGGFDECDAAFVGGVVEGALAACSATASWMVALVAFVAMGCFLQHQLGGDGKGDALLRSVCVICSNDAPEVVFVLYRVLLDLHQNGSKVFHNGGDVVIGQLVIDGGEYFRGLFEGRGDLFGRQHGVRGRSVLLVCLS